MNVAPLLPLISSRPSRFPSETPKGPKKSRLHWSRITKEFLQELGTGIVAIGLWFGCLWLLVMLTRFAWNYGVRALFPGATLLSMPQACGLLVTLFLLRALFRAGKINK